MSDPGGFGAALKNAHAGKAGRATEAFLSQIIRDREAAKQRGEITLRELRDRLEECYRSGYRFPRMGRPTPE